MPFQQAEKGIDKAEGTVKQALILSKECQEGQFGENRSPVGTRKERRLESNRGGP